MSSVRVAAIVLAAGEGRRIGRTKALISYAGVSFLARCCGTFLEAGVRDVVAVLGAEADRVQAEAEIPEGACVVTNERWREGMLSSVHSGLAVAERLGADAVLLHPVDNPCVSSATIEAVCSALRRGARIAIPCHAGRRGHPAGFARAIWPLLRAAAPERGARQVLADHPDWIEHLEAGPDCLPDIDTPADLARLSSPSRSPGESPRN